MTKEKREFYELPNVLTSADIINAARHHIKAASTSRPFTPNDNKRSLYSNRPASSHSSVDLSEISSNPRVLSPIESPKPQKKSAGSKKKEDENFEAYWRAKIAPILGSLAMKLENTDILKQVDDLSECLLRGGFLTGSVVLPQTYKVKVFQCLISLLDSKDNRLLLKIARILLCLGVYDKNLISISKLIFKLTKCEDNDGLFLSEKIVHCLLNVLNRYKIEENSSAFVYCIGAVKVLSVNTENTIADVLVQYGILQVLQRHLETCNTSTILTSEQKANLLIQIVGAIRNLCDIPATEPLLESASICTQLQYTMTFHYNDSEVLLNCSRLLSRMSLFSDTCLILSNYTDILNLLLKIVDNYTHDTQLLLRCCFVLGNVTAHHQHASLHLHEHGSILDSLTSLCKVYKGKLAERTTKENRTLVTEVLCKSVRVVTNVLQHQSPASSVSPQLIKLLVQLGQMSAQGKINEIVLNVLCGLNNLSYHNKECSIFLKHRTMLTDFLIKLLSINDIPITIETLGVLGNLSQHKDVVERIVQDKAVLLILTTLLDGDNSDLVYKACGVLVNVTKYPEFHKAISDTIVEQCCDILRDVGMLDTELSTVTSYLIWNVIFLKQKQLNSDTRSELLDILLHYTDEQYCSTESWINTFYPVAKRLLTLLDSGSELTPI